MRYEVNVIQIPDSASEDPKLCCDYYRNLNIAANPSPTTNNIPYHYCPDCGRRIA